MKRIILTLTLLLSAVCAPAWAQGSSAAQFLDISPDAASLSLGGSGLTLDAGAFSVWSNPASSALSSKKLAAGAAYGLWQSVYARFSKWRDDGTLEAVFHALSGDADMENLSVDSTCVKVHESANGREKNSG